MGHGASHVLKKIISASWEGDRSHEPTFKFDSVHVAFLHHSHCILDSLLRGRLVAAERQITHQERPACHCTSALSHWVEGRTQMEPSREKHVWMKSSPMHTEESYIHDWTFVYDVICHNVGPAIDAGLAMADGYGVSHT